jgi:hypothetical protein
MAHPYNGVARNILKEIAVIQNVQIGAPELARLTRRHPIPKRVTCHLHAITHTQNGHTQVEQLRVTERGTRIVNTARTPREDQPLGTERSNARGWNVMAYDLAVYVLLAHAARDELRVL